MITMTKALVPSSGLGIAMYYRLFFGAAPLLALLLISSACRSAAPAGGGSASLPRGPAGDLGVAATATVTPSIPRIQGQLTVFAAASLTDAFKQLGSNLEQANPGSKVIFNFAGSPTLRTQLAQGARSDLFVSADEPTMQGAQQDGSVAGQPQVFAQNRLILVTPAKDSAAPKQLADLGRPGVKLVIAQQNVPVGSYARQALAKMSQDPAYGSDFGAKSLRNVVSEEPDVKAALAKVQLGEADAGIVYATDVTPSVRPDVRVIAIPDQFNVIAKYPIALVNGAANPQAAQTFIDYLLSLAGQDVLRDWGFIPAGG